jgi:hypothetical protein
VVAVETKLDEDQRMDVHDGGKELQGGSSGDRMSRLTMDGESCVWLLKNYHIAGWKINTR